MSHRESGQIAPFITSCTPTTFAAAGTVSVTIDGTRFGTGMEVSCDAALGTISNVVITHPTATSSRVVFDLAVSAPSGSVARTITLSNAGISNGNSSQTVTHGFTVASLIDSTTPDGVYWDSTDASKNTFHANNGLSQWDSSAGKSLAFAPNSNKTGAPTTFPNSAATRGFSGAAKTNVQSSGFEVTTVAGVLAQLGATDPWTLGFVVHVNTATTQITQGGAQAAFLPTAGGSIGYKPSIDVIWASRMNSAHQHHPQKTNIAAGTYVIIGTRDGTGNADAVKLYVNGVDQGLGTAFSNLGSSSDAVKLNTVYTPEAIVGDLLVMERVLTSSEITSLNAYWTSKFV